MKKCPYCAEEIQDEAIVCKHCGRDIPAPGEENEKKEAGAALKENADSLIAVGWTISSMTDQQFVATRRKGINPLVVLIGVVGLLFYLIPGLLILLVGYAARGTETQIVTRENAQAWQAQKKQLAEKTKSDEDARRAAREKKIAELEGSPLQFWYKIPTEVQGLLVAVIAILILVLLAILAN